MEVNVEALSGAVARKKFERQLRALHLEGLHISNALCNLESDVILKKNLLATKNRLVRVYMISAFDLSSRDNGSASDPYLILECNNRTINERNKY